MILEIIGLVVLGGFGLWLTISSIGWYVAWCAFSGKHDIVPVVFFLIGIAILCATWQLLPWDLSLTRKAG